MKVIEILQLLNKEKEETLLNSWKIDLSKSWVEHKTYIDHFYENGKFLFFKIKKKTKLTHPIIESQHRDWLIEELRSYCRRYGNRDVFVIKPFGYI